MVDLHTHSTVSDGSDPPARIPELAAAAGCSAVALTDHDRLDGLAEARARAQALGVDLVPGCEVSCDWEPGTLHVLVYFVEPGDGPLQEELARLQADRVERNRRMIDRLAAAGLPVTLDELEAEAGGIGAGRPHMASILVRKGVVGSVQEAFDRYLARGRPGYVGKGRLSPRTVAAQARRSGGVAVLAHPLSLQLDEPRLDSVVAELADAGLGGLEARYGRYSPDERAGLADLAHRHGLVATGGSDYHGTYKPDLAVGSGRGDLSVPDTTVTALTERRP
ncbi:MAG TPA: PHP domain-containing protein [Acidimicrobiales bacterium]